MIFVDTSAWYASVSVNDADYKRVKGWLSTNSLPLVTTDYIVDETLTLLRARGEFWHAIELGKKFFSGAIVTVQKVNDQDYERAWVLFRDFSDKEWSFTDCTSKVVMDRLGIKTALALDHHFNQFGTIAIVP